MRQLVNEEKKKKKSIACSTLLSVQIGEESERDRTEREEEKKAEEKRKIIAERAVTTSNTHTDAHIQNDLHK